MGDQDKLETPSLGGDTTCFVCTRVSHSFVAFPRSSSIVWIRVRPWLPHMRQPSISRQLPVLLLFRLFVGGCSQVQSHPCSFPVPSLSFVPSLPRRTSRFLFLPLRSLDPPSPTSMSPLGLWEGLELPNAAIEACLVRTSVEHPSGGGSRLHSILLDFHPPSRAEGGEAGHRTPSTRVDAGGSKPDL